MAMKLDIPKHKIIIDTIMDTFKIHPTISMIFVVGILLILMPFFQYGKTSGWQFPVSPSGLIWVIPSLGGFLLIQTS